MRDQKALPGLTSNFLSIIAIGQNPVNADCNKLAPTKAANHSQFSECQYARNCDYCPSNPHAIYHLLIALHPIVLTLVFHNRAH